MQLPDFNEWLMLSESMSVYVKDYNSNNDIKDVYSLVYALDSKVLRPAYARLSPDEQAQINAVNPMRTEMLTPDGDTVSGDSDGDIINFYAAGWPAHAITNVVNGIQYYLKELGQPPAQVKQETSRMFNSPVVRFVISHTEVTENAPPDLNLANANARLIFNDVLGYNMDDDSLEMDAADLIMRIDNLPDHSADLHARDPYTSRSPNSATMYSGGIDPEQIKERLQRLRAIADWALKNNYSTLYVA